MHTDRCGNSRGQKCRAKGSGKKAKIRKFMKRDTSNMEHKIYDYTGSNWSHRNNDKSFK